MKKIHYTLMIPDNLEVKSVVINFEQKPPVSEHHSKSHKRMIFIFHLSQKSLMKDCCMKNCIERGVINTGLHNTPDMLDISGHT